MTQPQQLLKALQDNKLVTPAIALECAELKTYEAIGCAVSKLRKLGHIIVKIEEGHMLMGRVEQKIKFKESDSYVQRRDKLIPLAKSMAAESGDETGGGFLLAMERLAYEYLGCKTTNMMEV